MEDQDRLLDEATAVVKEQAFYLKRAIDGDNTREALKFASNMICELRTSLLSPKNYYELYMLVFQEMQHLHGYFCDKHRHGRKMVNLYESVQDAGNILPRLYLLATVGSAYIRSKEVPAKDILRDVSELCKGVQHPLRGLFLRYYLSQMMKDKLPDTGSEYEGDGGTMDDAFEFIFNNFNESNRLWARIQSQGLGKDRSKREKERHDLRVLVGANLVRLSQLEGMTLAYYSETALPKILDHIVSVQDAMSQQYLFESMVQVFPHEFHFKTLEQLLMAYTKAVPSVDMKPIVVTLMNRLAQYLSDSEDTEVPVGIDVFSLFRTHLNQILQRALTPSANATGLSLTEQPAFDLAPVLEVQAAFMQFTTSLYANQVHYIDLILASTVEVLRNNCPTGELRNISADKVMDLLACPLKALALNAFEMENYMNMFEFLDAETRKEVSVSIVRIVLEEEIPLKSPNDVQTLFRFISPLLKDEGGVTAASAEDKEAFVAEQQQVARLVHAIKAEDIDTSFQMLQAMRAAVSHGGPKRFVFTLPPLFYCVLALIPRIRMEEHRRANGEETEGPPPNTTVKKVFQFMHQTATALQKVDPEGALQLWLTAARSSDEVDRSLPEPGAFEEICYEFFTQALMCFEEEISETNKQFNSIFSLVGVLTNIVCLDSENYDVVSQKITQHAAKLMKKHLQVRAVAACSHLFWCQARRDSKRVVECLQKCLKITDNQVQSDAALVGLWVEILDKYVYYYEAENEGVGIPFIQNLLGLCQEHINYAEKDPGAKDEAAKAKIHLSESIKYIKGLKKSPAPEIQTRWAELVLP